MMISSPHWRHTNDFFQKKKNNFLFHFFYSETRFFLFRFFVTLLLCGTNLTLHSLVSSDFFSRQHPAGVLISFRKSCCCCCCCFKSSSFCSQLNNGHLWYSLLPEAKVGINLPPVIRQWQNESLLFTNSMQMWLLLLLLLLLLQMW